MKSIVVGFDGTDASFMAVDWAAERALRGVTRLDIIMVAGNTLTDDPRIDASLVAAEHRVHDRAPDCEITARRVPGHMPGALLAEANTADVLVIGAHAGRALRAALTGWLPSRIAAASPIPVVVVPEHWSQTDGPIVVGLDDDNSSAAAIDTAADEAHAAEVPLMLVHAWQMPAPHVEGAVSLLASPIRAKAEHAKTLRAAAQRIHVTHPLLLVEQVLVQEDPASALAIRARGAALLVLGTHHWGILAGGLFGSVTQDVLADMAVPVYVVPNEATREGHTVAANRLVSTGGRDGGTSERAPIC